MATSQTTAPQQQEEPVGAGGLVAVEGIRALYLAAGARALQLLRRATFRVLRAPDNLLERMEARRLLNREAAALVNQTAAEAHTAMVAVIEQAQQSGRAAAQRDLGQPPTGPAPSDRMDAEFRADEITVEHQRIVQVLDNAYTRVVNDALAAEPGRVNRQRAAQRALDDFAERGIRVFRDRAGREWDMATYAEMSIRTAVTAAQVDSYIARAKAAGVGFLQISHSVTCCPLCLPYDGKIIAIDSIPDARAAGLFHPNCRHRVSLVKTNAPPITRPAPDPSLYAAQQRLRYLERRVRAARRREAVALDPKALRRARAELRAAWAAVREHVDRYDLVRQRQREQIIRAR